jgi:hypothetical protein
MAVFWRFGVCQAALWGCPPVHIRLRDDIIHQQQRRDTMFHTYVMASHGGCVGIGRAQFLMDKELAAEAAK